MTDIYIVITEDRHADVEAAPFADEAAAFAHAEDEVAGTEDQDRELTEEMRRRGWLWYCGYGTEGDCVRVVRRELRRENPAHATPHRTPPGPERLLGNQERRDKGSKPRPSQPRCPPIGATPADCKVISRSSTKAANSRTRFQVTVMCVSFPPDRQLTYASASPSFSRGAVMARKGWQYSFEADSERAGPADGDRPCGRAEWCSAAVRERQPDGTSRRVPARTYQAFCPSDRDVIGRCLTAMPAAYVRLSIALGQQSAGEILVRMPFGPSVPVRTDADEIMRMLVDSVMTWRERVARVARLSAPDTQWWRRRALGRRAGALLPGSVPVLTAHLDALLALEPDVMVRPAMVPALGCGVTVAGWGDTAMVMAGGAEAGNEMMRLDYLSRACLGETNPLPEVLLGVACPECGQPKSLRRAAPPQHDGDPQWFAVCDRCRALLDDDEFRVHCRRLVRFYSHRVSPAVLASAGLRGDETVDIAAAAAA